MKRFSRLVVAICIIAIKPVMADNTGPSLNAECQHSIVTPTNGSDVTFNESCKTAYVHPPKTGNAEISSLARTTNLQFCPAVKDVARVTNNTFSSMAVLSDKIAAMIAAFEPLNQEVLQLRKDHAVNKSKRDIARIRFQQAETELTNRKQAERNAFKDYENCTLSDPSQCNSYKETWDKIKRELSHFYRVEYRNKRDDANETEETFNILVNKTEELSRRFTEAIAPLLDLELRLVELNEKVTLLYRNYVRLEGATGQITWSVNWDSLLEDYRKLNPGLRIKWVKMLMKNAQLSSTVKIAASSNVEVELKDVTAIKSAIIPGAIPTGFSGMPTGETVNGIQLQPSTPTQANITFGNAISGQIVMTLVGACPYFENIENRTHIDGNELTKYMVANLVYTYELAARRGYSTSYNLSNLLRKIESKTKAGGFFSTKVANAFAESDNSSDWFNIDFSANSADFQYSTTEQNELAVTVKKELIDRAMKQFSILNAGPSTPGSVPNFVESGAYRSSAELRKCSLGYCQVASAVIGVADSIWGKSSAAATFHRNNQAWATERVNGVQFVNRSGSLTFK